MICSMPGSSVLHYLLEFAQIHVQWLSNAMYAAHISCLQSFPAPGSFPLSWLFASDGKSNGASASASVLPLNIQGWFPLGLTGLISLQSRDSQKSSLASQFKSVDFWHSVFFMVQLSHLNIITGKTIALTIWIFVGKMMSLLLNTLSRFVIASLPRSKSLLISWL